MQLEIYSDTICPWCYVGKRRLERALDARPQPELSTRWRAFQLNPGMPADGMERRAYIEAKFGSAERARRIYDAVSAAGAGEGIAFAFDRIRRTPNTLQSHRLLRFAADVGRQNEMLDELFHAYFEAGADIGDTGLLVELAEAAGLDGPEVRRYLEGDEDRDAVIQEDQFARRQGINGVPCFIFNGRYALSGAQEPEAMFQLFDLSREDDAQQRQTSTA